MGRAKKTVITIKIPPLARANIERFLERLEKSIFSETVIGEIEGDTIRLQIYGSKLAVNRTLRMLRKLLKEYSTPKTGREKAYSLKLLSREAGISLPPDVLIEVLKAEGFSARVEEGRLYTDADQDTVLGVASLIADAIKKLEHIYSTRTAKKLLIAYLTLNPTLNPSEAVMKALTQGVLEEDDDGKLYVRGDWREALKTLLGYA